MKAKKLISLMLALCVALTMVSTIVFADSTTATIKYTVEDQNVKTGADVAIPLIVESSEEVTAFGCTLTYDKDLLAYVDFENTAELATKPMNSFNVVNDAENGILTITAFDQFDTFNGVIFTFNFTAASEISGTSAEANIDLAYLTQSATADDFFEIPEGKQTFVDGKITIRVAHEAPVVTAAIAGDAIVGKTLTASATFTDNWNITEGTKTYAWFIDGAEVATGETYVVKAADYGKAITAKATVTVDADENATGVGEATTAAVAYDATAKSAATVAIKSTVIAVGAPIEIETTTTKSVNDGEVALSYAWTYEDGTALAGEPVNEATYTPVLADYQAGKKIKVTVTPKGANDAIDGDAVSATTTTETVAGNMQPVIADLKVMKGETALGEEEAPVVGDVLTVAYTWSDVAEVGGPAETETDASVVTWTIGEGEDAEVVEAKEYEVKASDIGKAIKVTVDAVSTDATPNTNLGLDATEVVKGNRVEDTTAAVAKNTEYKPAVENVEFSSAKVVINKNVKVVYDYEDLNAIADASTFVIEVADTEDATEWTKVFEGTAADVNATDYKFGKDQLNKFARIAVTVKNAENDVPVEEADKVVYSDVVKVSKASSGSSGLTGPNLATGGATVPVKPVDPTTPDTPVIEVNKDAIMMTIDSKTMYIFGEKIENDVAPVIRAERTMLPARIEAESLGAEVAWDDATKTVTITKGETVIVITIGSDKATVNGEEVALDSPAFIENDRTYTPVRFIAEALGATVEWDDATKTVTIIPAAEVAAE